MGRDLVRRHVMEVGQEAHDVVRLERTGFVAKVKFDTVAGAEDDSLAGVARAESLKGTRQFVAIEGEALAQRDRGLVIVAADGEKDHGSPPLPRPMCGKASVKRSSPKATRVRRATRRPRRCRPNRK